MTAVAEPSPVERALDDAERDLVSATMYGGDRGLPDEARALRPDDFGNPKLRAVWEAVLRLDARGDATDAASVSVELGRRDDTALRIDRADLVALADQSALPGSVPTYVRRVQEASRRRQLRTVQTMLAQAESIADPEQSLKHAHRAAHLLAEITRDETPATSTGRPPLDLVAFLDEPDDEARPAVIPDVLERGERVILTANEGVGKSTKLRQIAVQVASGIHPYTLEPAEPQTVLLLDLENPRRHLRRELRKLRAAAGARYATGRLIVVSRPEGLDVLDATDRAWLLALVAAVRPALIVTGPLYKLAAGDPIEEKTARSVAQVLDTARTSVDAALILEAHTPHASNGRQQRPTRPYGASLWLRWPEFGLHLGDDGQITHWRGARDERPWPSRLTRGGAWPWTVADHTPASRPDDLTDDQRKCLDALTCAAQQMSTAEIATVTDLDRSRVSKACNALAERQPPRLDKYDTGRGKPVYYSLPEGV